MWEMHNVGAGWWILMSLGMVAFWGLVIWAIVSLARGIPNIQRDSEPAEPQTPLEILDRRLARGEVTASEYEEARELLVDRPRVPA